MPARTIGMKFRIYPTEKQKHMINTALGHSRFVYNHFLKLRADGWREHQVSLSYTDTSAMLTDLKQHPDYFWLNDVDSTALQQSLRDLQKSFDNFFAKRSRYPRLKSRKSHIQSYRSQCVGNNICIVGNRIQLPKIGRVKAKLSREVAGRILHATVTRTASGKYFVSLCVKQDFEVLPNAGGKVGIDVGLKTFCADSNGNVVENPRTARKWSRRLARAQRRMSRRVIGSRRRDRQRIRVARIHEKVVNIRHDFLHKLTTKLVRENQLIAVEELKIRNLLKNHHLARAISDVSWGTFFRFLEYKSPLYGAEIVRIPTFYPSSQTCHTCGFRNRAVKNLKVREWTCPSCGEHHDRDLNAAKNILAVAMAG